MHCKNYSHLNGQNVFGFMSTITLRYLKYTTTTTTTTTAPREPTLITSLWKTKKLKNEKSSEFKIFLEYPPFICSTSFLVYFTCRIRRSLVSFCQGKTDCYWEDVYRTDQKSPHFNTGN